MSSLKIHKITTADSSLIKFIHEEMEANEWYPGLEDIESYLAADDPGIYVAILDDEPIGFVSINKFSSSFYTFGLYFIKEKFRKKGYGIQLFRRASQDIDWENHNVSAYAVPTMLKPYTERYGFESRWIVGWYKLNIPSALQILELLPTVQGFTVKNIKDVDKQALLNYDTAVFGSQRNSFIWKRLHVKGSHSKVAVNCEGAIVGFTSARMLYNKKVVYQLGPLFADSIEVAQELLKALLQEVINHCDSSGQTMILACPTGRNASKELIVMLQGKLYLDLTFITTKDIPNGCFEKWFAITSLDIG